MSGLCSHSMRPADLCYEENRQAGCRLPLILILWFSPWMCKWYAGVVTAIKLPSSRREHVQWRKVEPISLCEPKVWKFLLVWYVILCDIGSVVICNILKGMRCFFSPPFISFPFLSSCVSPSLSRLLRLPHLRLLSTLISHTLPLAPSESHPTPSFFLHPSLCHPNSFYFFPDSFAIQDIISSWYFRILNLWVALLSPTLKVNNALSTRYSL